MNKIWVAVVAVCMVFVLAGNLGCLSATTKARECSLLTTIACAEAEAEIEAGAEEIVTPQYILDGSAVLVGVGGRSRSPVGLP